MSAFRALVLPGTPLLLPGVDAGEPAEMRQLRDDLLTRLADGAQWHLPVPAVPPVVSLGGLGVDRGAVVRRTGTGTGTIRSGEAVRGAALAAAVTGLTEAEAATARELAPALAVAALLAVEAGAVVRLRAPDAHPGADDDAPWLLPIDFSAAAHTEAPLAPRPGAADFDDALEAALTGPVDTAALRALVDRAPGAAAHIDALTAVGLTGTTGTRIAAIDPHHVRYRVLALHGGPGAHPAVRSGTDAGA